MFRLPALCCKTSVSPGSSPCLLGAVFSGLLEMLLFGLKSWKFLSTEAQLSTFRLHVLCKSTIYIISFLFVDLLVDTFFHTLAIVNNAAMKNWCFQTVVLVKPLEIPLDCKIKLVNPKGNQPWIFTGRTDAKVEIPILWVPDVKSQFTGKDPDDGEDWRQEEKRVTEDEMVAWQSPTQWIWIWANSGR